MRTRTVFVLLATFLFSVERMSAPIVEEEKVTPAPKPKHRVEAAPKRQEANKTASTPKVSFVGTWVGAASGEMHAPLASPNYTDNYKVQISPDEKTVNWTASKWLWQKFQAPVQKNGRTLSWSYQKDDIAGHTVINSSLQMNANGTATFREKDEIVGGWFKGSGYSVSGTLTRQQ